MFVKYGNLVVAVRSVTMVCPAAKLKIAKMRCYYADHGRNQEPYLQVVPGLLSQQKSYSQPEHQERSGAVMVLFIAMIQRNGPDQESQDNH